MLNDIEMFTALGKHCVQLAKHFQEILHYLPDSDYFYVSLCIKFAAEGNTPCGV